MKLVVNIAPQKITFSSQYIFVFQRRLTYDVDTDDIYLVPKVIYLFCFRSSSAIHQSVSICEITIVLSLGHCVIHL